MPTQTDIQLTSRATTVQNEVISKANTALRVGSLLIDMIFNKLNIDRVKTTGALGSSNTLVPVENIIKTYIDNLIVASNEPIGIPKIWPGAIIDIPSGYLLCNGSAISRATYSALFDAIGVTNGAGDGTTTFNLPNIGERVVAGYAAGVTGYDTVGATGGAGSVTLTDQQIAHQQSYQKYRPGVGGVDGDDGPQNFGYDTVVNNIGNPLAGRDFVDTRDKFIVFPYIIKY